MIQVNADNLPWVLIGLLLAAVLAVFYNVLRGNLVPRTVADQLRESEEKRAEVSEAGTEANTRSLEAMVDMLGKLMVLAENQERVLQALRDSASRARNRGGS